MELSKAQKEFYKNTLDTTEKEIKDLEEAIERELAAVKERLAELQNRKKGARQIYDAACMILKVENKLKKMEKALGDKKSDMS